MISLTDPQWNNLEDAYGPATDVPKLLEQLAKDPSQRKQNDEPWFTLWSKLCHQGDIYTASYAAVPHIVKIALETSGSIDFSFFLLPACVEVARANGRCPKIPDNLSVAYFDSVKKLSGCVAKHKNDPSDKPMAESISIALAVARGDIEKAEKMLNQDYD